MEGKKEKRFGAVTAKCLGNGEPWNKDGAARVILEAEPLFRDHQGQTCENAISLFDSKSVRVS